MIQGVPKFTALAIGELTVNTMGSTTTIRAKAAFIDPATAVTYGWTNAEGAVWSQETMAKLKDLLNSMESDLVAIHFEGGGSEASSPLSTAAPTGGLGEHVGGDAPSV